MKKSFFSLITLLLGCTLLFCACDTTLPLADNSGSLVLATGGSTETYHDYGREIADILNANLNNIEIKTQTSGASKANVLLIEDNKADLAIVSNDVMYYAYNGTELFAKDGAVTSFSAVAGLYAEVCQIVANEDITSIGQLKGKRVAIGETGSSTESNARHILSVYGISFDDIIAFNYTLSDAIDALKNGKIDAFICTEDAPLKDISKLSAMHSINLLSMDTAHVKKLTEAYPFYSRYTIPLGSYNDIDQNITTVAVKATLVASNDLSPEIVKSIVQTLFTHQTELADLHKKGAELTPQFAVAEIKVPFHAGASAYFTEYGVF